jgi:hypothetical protein
MLRLNYFSIALFVLMLSTTIHAQSLWVMRDTPQLPNNDQHNYGIGLVFFELNQHNVSMIIQLIDEDRISSRAQVKQKLDFDGKELKLDFSGRSQHVAVNLPEGLYQIKQVDVPHFDLPFKVSTDNSDIWRFRIRAGHVSYLGFMQVGAVRGKDTVDVVWLNRFATQLEQFKSVVVASGVDWPIAHGAGYQDDFFSLLEQSKQ